MKENFLIRKKKNCKLIKKYCKKQYVGENF